MIMVEWGRYDTRKTSIHSLGCICEGISSLLSCRTAIAVSEHGSRQAGRTSNRASKQAV